MGQAFWAPIKRFNHEEAKHGPTRVYQNSIQMKRDWLRAKTAAMMMETLCKLSSGRWESRILEVIDYMGLLCKMLNVLYSNSFDSRDEHGKKAHVKDNHVLHQRDAFTHSRDRHLWR